MPAAGVTRVPEREIGARADLVIAIGGDGTLLYAARLVAGHAVPLLGINRGRLGFLTDVMPQDMLPSVDAALAGAACRADQRPLLRARLHGAHGPLAQALALNDVVMQKHDTGRMLDFETRIDGRYVNTHDGDGIIVASATGSTAYALSCGGPIIEPHLPALVIAPICAHTLSDRPIVVAAGSVIEITLLERADTRANVTCDGMMLGALEPGDRLEITTAAERVTLLHPPGHDYYRLLRSKLHWGRGSFTSAEHHADATCRSATSPSSMPSSSSCAPGSRCSPARPAPANRSSSMRCSCSPAGAPAPKWCATAPSAPKSAAHLRARQGAARAAALARGAVDRTPPASSPCAASSAATAARAPISTGNRCRCSCCARRATSSSTSTASTNFSP